MKQRGAGDGSFVGPDNNKSLIHDMSCRKSISLYFKPLPAQENQELSGSAHDFTILNVLKTMRSQA